MKYEDIINKFKDEGNLVIIPRKNKKGILAKKLEIGINLKQIRLLEDSDIVVATCSQFIGRRLFDDEVFQL